MTRRQKQMPYCTPPRPTIPIQTTRTCLQCPSPPIHPNPQHQCPLQPMSNRKEKKKKKVIPTLMALRFFLLGLDCLSVARRAPTTTTTTTKVRRRRTFDDFFPWFDLKLCLQENVARQIPHQRYRSTKNKAAAVLTRSGSGRWEIREQWPGTCLRRLQADR